MVFAVVIILLPVIAISFSMTSKSKKTRAAGFFGLSAFLFLAALVCFSMAYTGENRAGYMWMGLASYGSYWAWMKAKAQLGA